MLKNLSKFETTIEGKLYQLFCDSDSQLPNLKEFVYQVLKVVGQIEDSIKAQNEAKQASQSEPAPQENPVKEEDNGNKQ